MTSPHTSPPAVESRKNRSDDVFLSGSSLGKVLQNRVLENWANNATAEWVADNSGLITGLVLQDKRGEAIQRIKDARWEGSSEDGPMTAAERGTAIHSVIESWLVGEDRAQLDAASEAQIAGHLNAVAQWFIDCKPEPVAIEMVVYNDFAGTAGRGDMWLRFTAGPLASDRVYLVDTKTKREALTKRGYPVKPYSEVGLQLAAYRWAESAWLMGDWEPRIARKGDRSYYLNKEERARLTPMAEVIGDPMEVGTLILQVTPEGSQMFPIDTDRDVLHWVKDVAGANRGKDLSLVGSPVWTSEGS